MKRILITILLSILMVYAQSSAVQSIVKDTPATIKSKTENSAPSMNDSVTFATLVFDSVYNDSILNAWSSIPIPVKVKKLFISKGIDAVSATEIYGRILMQCGTIHSYSKLVGQKIDAVKGKCFEFNAELFQQIEDKAGLYDNNDVIYYVTLLSTPPEAISGWVKATDLFKYNTAMAEEKSVVELKELLVFIEGSLIKE